ncbi:MAG: nickel insertion protein [Phycisphaerales bacterium JB063]
MAQTVADNTPTRVVELVVNLDDTTGEAVGRACATLLDAGALDVWTTAITMKHGRPGVMLSLLAGEDERDRFARLMLEATGSFGVRARPWDRVVLERELIETPTRLGPVRLKVGRLDGVVVSIKPEFADVERLASASGVSLGEALAAAQAEADRWRAAQGGRG